WGGCKIDFGDECTAFFGNGCEPGSRVDDPGCADDEQDVVAVERIGAAVEVIAKQGFSEPDNMGPEQRPAMGTGREDGNRHIAVVFYHATAGAANFPDVAMNLRDFL